MAKQSACNLAVMRVSHHGVGINLGLDSDDGDGLVATMRPSC